MHRARKVAGVAALGSALLWATAIGGCSLLVSVEGLSDPTTVDDASVDATVADVPDTFQEVDAGSHDAAAEAGARPRIFVIGGSEDGTTFPDVTPVHYAEILDDGMLGPWQLGAPLPKPAMWHAAATGNDLIALVGGLTKPEGDSTRVVIGSVTRGLVESYFTSSPVLPTPRNHAGAVVRGSTLYVFGGVDEAAKAKSDVLTAEVGPSTVSAFSVRASLPSPIARMGFAEIDNAVFLVGGGNETTPRGVSITKASFLPDGGVAFTAASSLPEAQRYGAACVHDNVLVVLGGEGASTDIATVLVYPISADGKLGPYRTTTPLPYSRSRSRAIAYNHRIYVVGGRVGAAGDARDVLVGDLEPAGGVNSWRTTSPLPTTVTFHTATLIP